MSLKAFSDYIRLEKKYSEHTLIAYSKDIDSFYAYLNEEYGQLKDSQIAYSHIRTWIIQLVESGVSNRSINRKISSLNAYFKFLQKSKHIDKNPLRSHKALKTSKKVQVPFSIEEVEETIRLLDDDKSFNGIRNKLILELFYTTGIRRSELINIKEIDIDYSGKYIRVLGKRNKERQIPLLNSVISTIKEYVQVRSQLEIPIEQPYLLLTEKGLKLYETLVYRVINNYFRITSTKLKKSPHMLRHSFATHLLNQGANLNAVKELLGHSSLAATQLYTHSSIAELKKVHLESHPRSQK